jgi:peroxiredoxin
LQVYQQHLAEITALGASLIAVSPNAADHSLTMAEKEALSFDVLSDLGNEVARSWRLTFPLPDVLREIYARIGADLPKFNADTSWELPMPGTFVIDPTGVVRLAFVDADYTKRLEVGPILAALSR